MNVIEYASPMYKKYFGLQLSKIEICWSVDISVVFVAYLLDIPLSISLT